MNKIERFNRKIEKIIQDNDRYDCFGKEKTDIFTRIKYSEEIAKENLKYKENNALMKKFLGKENICR